MVEASVVGIRTSIMGKDMQTQRFVLSLMLVAGAALSMSCAASQDSGEAEPKLVATYDELVAALRDNGSAVESSELISQPFFEPRGQVIKVDGYDVQVFVYTSEEDASSVAKTIGSDGSSVGTTMISWVEAPHFFKSGNLIVLYVREVDDVVEALQAVLGSQIAGR